MTNYKGVTAFIAITISVLLMSGCGKKEKPTPLPPVKVTVEAVSPHNSGHDIVYSGTVSASNTTSVSFVVPGTITALYANEGEKVSKGQLLGKVRSGDYENAKNIAEAELAEAQDAYQRLKKLHDANALPDVKWVEIQQKVAQAKNAVEMADRALNDATLHSPVAGTVSRRLADVGQTVLSVQPVYEIVSTDELTIDIPVSENNISKISVGDKAQISFDGQAIGDLEGKVIRKSVVADPLTRTYAVKISLPHLQGKILPGMVGSVKFNEEANDSLSPIMVLPSQAVLLNSDNRNFVWVVKDGKAHRRFVVADELAAQGVIVKEGLVPGDSVIVEGMRKVGNGTQVIALTK